jgi:hypothetical protein
VKVFVGGETAGEGEQVALAGVFKGEFRTRKDHPRNCLFQRPSDLAK